MTGRTVGSADVSGRAEGARKDFGSVGLGADYVKRFIGKALT